MPNNIFMSVATQRYSCRSFSDRKVERELLEELLQAARMAPSACNRQPWMFYVVNTPEKVAELKACYAREWMENVGTFIVAVGNHNEGWHRTDGKDHTNIDVAIAVEHICLAAAAAGLGTCWVCNFDVSKCTQLLGLGVGEEPIVIIPVGYPTKSAFPEKNRKNVDEIVKWVE